MLCLTRKRQERVVLTVAPEDLAALAATGQPLRVVVTTIEMMPDKVKLGFEGPRAVAIHREEVQRRVDTKHGVV